jgi:RHS repeat-associated protein
VYVSNETNAASIVDFDNLTITHSKTPVVFASDFYPFGLQYNTFTRNYSEPVRYKFQEQEHDDATRWIAFKWRNHDPTIGRFFNIDPLSEKYLYNSTYAFSENKVVAHREIEGLESSYNMAAENFKNQMEYAGKKYDKYIGKPLQKFASTVGNAIATAWTSLDKYAFSDEPPQVTPRDAPTQPDGNDNRQADGTPEFNPNEKEGGKDGDNTFTTKGGQELKPNKDEDGKSNVKELENTSKQPKPDSVKKVIVFPDGTIIEKTVVNPDKQKKE